MTLTPEVSEQDVAQLTPAADAPAEETMPVQEAPEQESAAPDQEAVPVTRPVRRRAPKLDAVLAEAVDTARAALAELAPESEIGEHLHAVADDDRLVTHRFAGAVEGYAGWDWFITLARAPRSRHITVCESGLLPGPGALLAPDWVPWAERVSDEERARLEAIARGEDPATLPAVSPADSPESPADPDQTAAEHTTAEQAD